MLLYRQKQLGKEITEFESKLDLPKVDLRREKRPTSREENQGRSTPPKVPHLSQGRMVPLGRGSPWEGAVVMTLKR
ncbi:hypothetical protein JTB14_024696 [Gonioctena quinquepunctata]|nr:hypothetical protein JTB14_024696 [Gonioctena quinquepunctata]